MSITNAANQTTTKIPKIIFLCLHRFRAPVHACCNYHPIRKFCKSIKLAHNCFTTPHQVDVNATSLISREMMQNISGHLHYVNNVFLPKSSYYCCCCVINKCTSHIILPIHNYVQKPHQTGIINASTSPAFTPLFLSGHPHLCFGFSFFFFSINTFSSFAYTAFKYRFFFLYLS